MCERTFTDFFGFDFGVAAVSLSGDFEGSPAAFGDGGDTSATIGFSFSISASICFSTSVRWCFVRYTGTNHANERKKVSGWIEIVNAG